MKYNEKLKEIRKYKNMKMKYVAEKAGISQSSLSYIESGTNAPTIETLSNILSVYEMTLSDFFNENQNAIVLSNELKELIDNTKGLTPGQLSKLTEFLKTLK